MDLLEVTLSWLKLYSWHQEYITRDQIKMREESAVPQFSLFTKVAALYTSALS
jgi:hypothetical protein